MNAQDGMAAGPPTTNETLLGTPISKFFVENYNYIFHTNADPRVLEWPLIGSEWPTVGISFFYVFFVCWIGPRLMQGRKPYQLKNTMAVYNAFQVIFSSWIFSMCIRGGWLNGYSFTCQPIEFAPSPRGQIMAEMMWWFFISKFIDFMDSVFFVLRKKFDQISFLHIGHHGGMPFGCWYAVRFLPGGHVSFVPLLNSFVHMVMYSYYFLAGMGPAVQKYLWWKKYLTMFQMVQFVLMVVHQAQLLFSDCNYPKYQCYWGFLFGPWIFILFLNFYMDSYSKRYQMRKEKEDAAKKKHQSLPQQSSHIVEEHQFKINVNFKSGGGNNDKAMGYRKYGKNNGFVNRDPPGGRNT